MKIKNYFLEGFYQIAEGMYFILNPNYLIKINGIKRKSLENKFEEIKLKYKFDNNWNSIGNWYKKN